MKDLLEQYGLTRTKLVVIASLVLVMAAVWGSALGGRGVSTSQRDTADTPMKAASETNRPNSTGGDAEGPVERRWRTLPEASVPQVGSHDPFARPRWALDNTNTVRKAIRPSLSEREALLQELKTQGVSMVLVAGERKVATVGGRHVQPGDILSGFRVLDITSSGIVLSEDLVEEEL